jgi:hypothetical protein
LARSTGEETLYKLYYLDRRASPSMVHCTRVWTIARCPAVDRARTSDRATVCLAASMAETCLRTVLHCYQRGNKMFESNGPHLFREWACASTKSKRSAVELSVPSNMAARSS